jgi:16S rRNA (cytosine967-C5)-methyltransferase
VLRRVFERGAYADRALQSHALELSARDRQLARHLVFGATQRRGTIDHLIEILSERAPGKLDAAALTALRMGLYELLYMDGAPDRAVVNDAVTLTRSAGSAGHGLVNAVLRRGAREGRGLLEGLSDDTPQHAGIAHSHPEWIARHWFKLLGGDEARALMSTDNQPPQLALRVNTLRTDPQTLARELPVPTRTDPDLPEALILDGPFDAHGCQLFRDGAYTPQSRGAMIVARVLDPQPGERVLDLCAAPGAKSTHLAALMGGEGEILAVERNRRRAGDLARNARRLGAHNIRVELADATVAQSSHAPFDRVLVDPPCSGLGTLQSHPDLRWRIRETDIAAMASTQAAILDAAGEVLRPGGVLVYSTCTISATENEHVIVDFLDRNDDFQLEDLSGEFPALAETFSQRKGMLQTLPHRDRTAGFFIARLRRG